MRGSIQVPFSVLFRDTVLTHGADWADMHYLKRGMSATELAFWHRATGV